MKSIKSVSFALGALTLISVVRSAHADDFPGVLANAQSALTRGFSQPALPVLRRATTANLSTTKASLVEKLCAAPCVQKTTTTPDKALRIESGQWSLEIRDDGAFGRFEDRSVQARAHSLGKSPSAKTSAVELEKAGRAFIASTLSSAIVLGPGEELIPVRTDYRSEWGQDIKTGAISRSVVASRIVFGRTLHNMRVVGGGSSVVITFTNDGAVESFQYDWPRYEEAAFQNVADPGELLRRVQKVISARSGLSEPLFTTAVPVNPSSPYPLPLGADVSLQKLECGYFDPGSTARNTHADIQPGCVYHAVEQGGKGLRRGFAGAVPAGNPFTPDAAWTENTLLRGAVPAASKAPASARNQ
jgi:hypothetical protein